MNAIRIAISVFNLMLIALSTTGWIWNGSQPSPQATGARAALALCALAGLIGLVVIWRPGPRSPQ